ncbi:LysR substrate-binding domain-containing protein [Lactobacillus sp. YT155]|nr:LysR substrate-binding domain-containing protein [Lactobacillus sp. YT155]MDO1604794.1 LysR substrate-binding domain-containing protein [Lactobacillus sp. YT155]
MGFPPIITNYFSKYFSYFKDINILSTIEPITSESQILMKQIINGDLDATLVGTANLLNNSDLETKLLRTHEFKIVSAKNRVLSKNSSLSLSDIRNEYMIVLDENSVHNKILSNLYSSMNIDPNILFKTPDYKLALDLIAQDKGIGFFTETALLEPEKYNIYSINEAKDINFYIYLVYRKDKILNDDLSKLISTFEKNNL